MPPPNVDLSDLQNTVGQFIGQHKYVAAAGPLTAATLVRVFITKNKLVTAAVVAGSSFLAIQAVSGSSLKLMHDQFAYLESLVGLVR